MDQFKNGRRICILAVREVKTFVTLQVSPHIYISTGKGSCVQDGQCEQTNLGQQNVSLSKELIPSCTVAGDSEYERFLPGPFKLFFHLLRHSRIVLRCLAWWY